MTRSVNFDFADGRARTVKRADINCHLNQKARCIAKEHEKVVGGVFRSTPLSIADFLFASLKRDIVMICSWVEWSGSRTIKVATASRFVSSGRRGFLKGGAAGGHACISVPLKKGAGFAPSDWVRTCPSHFHAIQKLNLSQSV